MQMRTWATCVAAVGLCFGTIANGAAITVNKTIQIAATAGSNSSSPDPEVTTFDPQTGRTSVSQEAHANGLAGVTNPDGSIFTVSGTASAQGLVTYGKGAVGLSVITTAEGDYRINTHAAARASLDWSFDVDVSSLSLDGSPNVDGKTGRWALRHHGSMTGDALDYDGTYTIRYKRKNGTVKQESYLVIGRPDQDPNDPSSFSLNKARIETTPLLFDGETITIFGHLEAFVRADHPDGNPYQSIDLGKTIHFQFIPDSDGLSVMDSDGYDYSEAYVPEPGCAVAALTLGGAWAARRRRRKEGHGVMAYS